MTKITGKILLECAACGARREIICYAGEDPSSIYTYLLEGNLVKAGRFCIRERCTKVDLLTHWRPVGFEVMSEAELYFSSMSDELAESTAYHRLRSAKIMGASFERFASSGSVKPGKYPGSQIVWGHLRVQCDDHFLYSQNVIQAADWLVEAAQNIRTGCEFPAE